MCILPLIKLHVYFALDLCVLCPWNSALSCLRSYRCVDGPRPCLVFYWKITIPNLVEIAWYQKHAPSPCVRLHRAFDFKLNRENPRIRIWFGKNKSAKTAAVSVRTEYTHDRERTTSSYIPPIRIWFEKEGLQKWAFMVSKKKIAPNSFRTKREESNSLCMSYDHLKEPAIEGIPTYGKNTPKVHHRSWERSRVIYPLHQSGVVLRHSSGKYLNIGLTHDPSWLHSWVLPRGECQGGLPQVMRQLAMWDRGSLEFLQL